MITIYLVYYLLVYIITIQGDHCIFGILFTSIVTIQGDHCIFGILFTSIYSNYSR